MCSVMLKVEQDFRDSNPQEAYKNINMFKKGFKLSTTLCKSKHGYIITEREKVTSRWKQYFEELLNPDINHWLVMQNEEQVVSLPTKQEIVAAVDKVKNNKAPDTDNLLGELLK